MTSKDLFLKSEDYPIIGDSGTYYKFSLIEKQALNKINGPCVFLYFKQKNDNGLTLLVVGETKDLSKEEHEVFDKIGDLKILATHIGFLRESCHEQRQAIIKDIRIMWDKRHPGDTESIWLI